MEWYNGESLYGESIAMIFLIVAGVIANLPVLIVYAKSKHIRSITDKFLLNLLVADIVALTLLLPSILTSFVHYSSLVGNQNMPSSSSHAAESIPGAPLVYFNTTFDTQQPPESSEELLQTFYWKWSCTINKALISGVATASVLAALEIALERYLAVVTPLHYHKVLTTPSISLVSASGGLISLASFLISAFDPSHCLFPACYLSHSTTKTTFGGRLFQSSINNTFAGTPNTIEDVLHSSKTLDEGLTIPLSRFEYDEGASSWTDGIQNDSEGSFEHPHHLIWAICNLVHIALVFVLPVILMSFIYVRIYLEARRQKIRMTQRYKPYFLPVTPNQINPFDSSADFKEKASRFDPIFVRFRLMDRFRPPRLDRALRVAVFALVVTVLCWTPYYIVRAANAIKTIMVLSGSRVSLNPHEANEDVGSQLPSLLSLGGESPVLSNEGTKWNSVYPLLFASLHPLLASVFYAYRYKRLRLEILRVICDSLSICVRQDQRATSASTTTSRGGNGGLSNSSTCGGSPCIRQTIAIPEGDFVTSGAAQPSEANAIQSCSTIRVGGERDVPQIIISAGDSQGAQKSVSVPESPRTGSRHSSISIRIDSVDDESPRDLMCLPCESRGESHLGLRRVETAISSEGSSEGVVRMERSVGTFVNCLTVWMNSYSRRWLQHRESVTSTASFITLLSSKYHNKAHPVANV